jgi:hypothetical protein
MTVNCSFEFRWCSLRGDSYRLKDRDLGRPTSAANDDQ